MLTAPLEALGLPCSEHSIVRGVITVPLHGLNSLCL